MAAAQTHQPIQIRVTDPSGQPLAATVKLTNLAGDLVALQATLGTYGNPGVAPGEYRISISSAGYATFNKSIQHTATQPTRLDAMLQVGFEPYRITVQSTTPLLGAEQLLDRTPATTHTSSAEALETSQALDLSDYLKRRVPGIFVNEIQGNPIQPDINFRGYTASPLLGTPQGLSIYMDGVRLNQPFGDVVSWDLIPRNAIGEATLVTGSNPLFGLNTLGGAVSLRTKDGRDHAGTALSLYGGSFGRRVAELEHGGSISPTLHYFTAANLLFENGWRENSPSNVRQFFGKLGWQRGQSSYNLAIGFANNSLVGNGLQELSLLQANYRSIYTQPDATNNRSPFFNLSARRNISSKVTVSANAYFRYIRTLTLNGDINEESLDQSLYQPNAAERAALIAAGFTGFPLSGESAANAPFPRWRCIANVLLNDEPSEKCNGLLNRGGVHQRNYGASGQVTWSTSPAARRNVLTVGGAYDGNRVGFTQSTELGYLNPDRTVTPLGAFGDGVTGGEADGEPFDNRVDLSSRIHTGSVYAVNTITLHPRLTLTASGRFHHARIDNRDILRPTAGTGSLTGFHTFTRFNPAVGFTYRVASAVTSYFNYSEANRTPTAIELGCADPESPCRLPNALAGDPPLKQVVTRTVEGGVRSSAEATTRWSAGYFRSDNRNDILFVASEQTGFGYFRNFGRTLRQGMELDFNSRYRRLTYGAGYTLLDATFQSPEEVNGTGNSTNEAAADGVPGIESSIKIAPGNQIPLSPRHMGKAFVDYQATRRLLVGFNAFAAGSSFARGNENNLHQPEGRYYVGPGTSPGYAILGAQARYQWHPKVQLFAQMSNLANRRYYTGAQLGPAGFLNNGNFIARPFPAIDGEFPLRQSTFFAPGAPRAAWAGLRFRF